MKKVSIVSQPRHRNQVFIFGHPRLKRHRTEGAVGHLHHQPVFESQPLRFKKHLDLLGFWGGFFAVALNPFHR